MWVLRGRVALILSAVVVLNIGCGNPAPDGHGSVVGYGWLIEVNLEACGVRPVGYLTPTALYSAYDSSGRIWARSGQQSVAAMEPETGQVVASVALPDPPHLLACVSRHILIASHNTLRPDGFSASIIDPTTAELIGTLRGFPGPVTGIAAAGRAVFVATLATGADELNCLYRIPIRDIASPSSLPEPVLAERRGSAQWRISAHRGLVFLVDITGRALTAPQVRVLNARTGEIIGSLDAQELGDITHIIDAPFLLNSTGVMPVLVQQESTAVALLNLSSLSLRRTVALSGPISRIIAADEDTVAYVDSLATADERGLRVTFAVQKTGEEVGSVYLAEATQGAPSAQNRQ